MYFCVSGYQAMTESGHVFVCEGYQAMTKSGHVFVLGGTKP